MIDSLLLATSFCLPNSERAPFIEEFKKATTGDQQQNVLFRYRFSIRYTEPYIRQLFAIAIFGLEMVGPVCDLIDSPRSNGVDLYRTAKEKNWKEMLQIMLLTIACERAFANTNREDWDQIFSILEFDTKYTDEMQKGMTVLNNEHLFFMLHNLATENEFEIPECTFSQAADLMRLLSRLPLKKLKKLEFVDNRPITGENDDFISEMTILLQKTEALTTLNLRSNCLGREKLEIIGWSIPKLSNLRVLNLRDNPLYDDGAKILAGILEKIPQLEVLNLRNVVLNGDGMVVLAPTLPKMVHLQSLDLGSNFMNGQGASALAKVLDKMTSLQKLNISHNAFGLEEMATLAGPLQRMANLTSLKLCRNHIGDSGAQTLIGALKSLQVLDLNENSIGGGGAISLAGPLGKMANLRILNLSRNKIGNRGAFALAEGLSTSNSLEHLEVSECEIDPIGAWVLWNALGTIPSGIENREEPQEPAPLTSFR